MSPLQDRSNGTETPDAAWLQPPSEEAGLSSYVRTLRERIWLVIGMVALTTLVAIAYVTTASPTYEAESDMIIFPAGSSEQSLVQLPLLRESADPTAAIETAARLIVNPSVAERVKEDLDSPLSTDELQASVTAEPIAQSNVIAVTARAPSAEEARDLANGFAEAAIAERREALHDYIDQTLPGLRDQLEANPDSELRAEVAQLEALRQSDDPTLRIQTEAMLPTAPAAPRKKLSVAVGILAGLILGVGGAFAIQILDPRLRREEQLRRLYRLPILARIPREIGRSQTAALNPLGLSPATAEAYRTLRGTLAVSHRRTSSAARRGSTAILVTGSSPSEGKTTSAINLAASLAAAGSSVILIEADLRRPGIGRALAVAPRQGIVSVLIESVALEDVLVTSDRLGPNLRMLLAEHEGGWITELFALPAARQLVDEARELADYVIIDSPPLTDVIDALPLASYVDDVLIVTRLGKTRLANLARLGELLAEIDVKPVGFVVVGTSRPARSEYLYYQEGRKAARGSGGGSRLVLERPGTKSG